ncbi:hypothetical protein OAL97_05535, partial [Paracoccaceae bacterium]|nr:hypothetical protein [Paracoccaceae bacterium]
MKNWKFKICLAIATIFGNLSASFALPNCPSDQLKPYHNCFGTRLYDNAKYTGEWKNNNAHGHGTFIYGPKTPWAGNKYIGEFKKDMFNGEGTYIYKNGDVYVGEFKDDLFSGEGTKTYTNGIKEEGLWRKGHFQGFQIGENSMEVASVSDASLRSAFIELSRQKRSLIQKKLSLLGFYNSSIDSIYGAETANALTIYNKKYFKAPDLNEPSNVAKLLENISNISTLCEDTVDFRSCFGEILYSNGTKYIGEFENEQENGIGSLSTKNGMKYKGQFLKGQKHGYGEIIFANGDRYSGNFSRDFFHGQGKFILANGAEKDGLWERGQLQNLLQESLGEALNADLSKSFNQVEISCETDTGSGPSMCTNNQLCDKATEKIYAEKKWSIYSHAAGYVREAKRRGLTCGIRAVELFNGQSIPQGVTFVQFGSFGRKLSANSLFLKITEEFAHLFRDKKSFIQTVKINGKDLFRLRTMGFTSVDDARSFCSIFVTNKIECIPIAPIVSDIKAIEKVQSCDSDPASCTILQLCSKASLSRNGVKIWNKNTRVANYVSEAKKNGLLCGTIVND